MSVSPHDRQGSTYDLHPPKRTSPPMDQSTTGPPRKRRARYVWRACDVCRRRKGRCDGRKPCVFCQSRGLECCYTSEPDPPNGSAPGDEAATTAAPPLSTASVSFPAKGESVSRLVLALQAQLDSLVAHVESCNDTQNAPNGFNGHNGPSPPRSTISLDAISSTLPPHESLISSTAPAPTATATSAAAASPPKNATRRFCGPTSPDYSLNAAEIKLRQTQLSIGGTVFAEETNPSLEDDLSEGDQYNLIQDGHSSNVPSSFSTTRLRQCLAQLPRLLARNETLRLLNVYHDIVGQLHPILDLKRLIQQAEACYTNNRRSLSEPCIIQDNTVIILFLALAIALSAETVSQSYIGKTIYKSVEHLIKLKLASEVSSLDHVLIALLAAICHFFNDEIRLAWRVCGISGRMAMELGLHRRDVHQQLLRDESQHAEISALLWSIVVLDRQWSAATGLPQNFQESDFDQAMEPPENASYLRAMISYTFMSPKIEGPIYHVAAGASYEPDDAFEVLNFQIDQWLKKAIEGQALFHPCPAEAIGVKPITDLSKRPSPTATLLYLRANAFRSIILRPFFLSSFPSHVSVKMIKPSMTIISDTLGVLSLLDSTTDVYRNQHPFFQHFLGSSSALLFLVVAYFRADRNRSLVMQTDLPEPFHALVKRDVERALALASAYSTSSQISSRLAKRLRYLEEQLSRPDFLQPPNDQSQRFQRGLMDKGNTISSGMEVNVDASDMFQVIDQPIGEDVLNGGWWNDVDILWPDWPTNEITANWL
ncbi:hypothetical protein GQ44DRAFT_777517 [Phaeosphaeriaceae sp. PMI808]|nr:hypothetical protein GQ44DRAFT_777517 [Phaeosphaeriaceae sp. PMI808]